MFNGPLGLLVVSCSQVCLPLAFTSVATTSNTIIIIIIIQHSANDPVHLAGNCELLAGRFVYVIEKYSSCYMLCSHMSASKLESTFFMKQSRMFQKKYIIKLLMFRQCRATVYFIFPLLLIILGFIFHSGRNIHFISRMTRFCILFTASVFIPFYEEMKGIYRLNILIKIFGSEHGFLLVKRSFLLVKRFSSTQL